MEKHRTLDIENYQKVYIILKSDALVLREDAYFKDKAIRYDKKKEKYFILGQLIRHAILGLNNVLLYTWPEDKYIAVLPEVYKGPYDRFPDEKNKRAYVLHMPIKDIETITIMPESFK